MRIAKISVFIALSSIVLFLAASPIPKPSPYLGPSPVYLATGTLLTNTHEVVGRVSGTSPINVQLSGASHFSGANTYFCLASGGDDAQTLGPQVVNVDGTHFRIVHASAEPASVTYRCIGM